MATFFQNRTFYQQKFPSSIQYLKEINEILTKDYNCYDVIKEFIYEYDEDLDYNIECSVFKEDEIEDDMECDEELIRIDICENHFLEEQEKMYLS